jgi:TolB-like protein/DNA-binding winged helix-turn-helix (wHTH) protein/tetratricopeptide (TPR) repeat protein
MSTARFLAMLDPDPAPDATPLTPEREHSQPLNPPAVSGEARILRFGRFEADLDAGLLSRDGTPVKLQPQPFKVLALLARRAGQVVTRDEIRLEVWGEDTFVNFDQGLAYCLNQIRGALGEQAQAHQYIQTLPRRGYRFIAPVSAVLRDAADVVPAEPPPLVAPRPRRRRALLTASAVAAVLAALAVVRSLPTPASGDARTLMAVLPFEDLGTEAAADHLGDGMTEEMITEIGRISPERLGVISRGSAMRYKDARPDLEVLGRELGVSHVLEGTVRSDGGRVRVTARLVRIADRAQMWARTYDRQLKDVLALQARVADDVARSVQGTLNAGETPRPQARPVDPEVYRLLTQARYFWHRRTVAGFRKALSLYEEASRRDPSSAAAFAGIAQSWIGLANTRGVWPPDAYRRGREAVLHALELDPDLGEAHAMRAALDAIDGYDWVAAERGYRRALELNPGDAVAHHWYSVMLCIQGRQQESVEQARRAYASDPVSPVMANNLAGMLLVSGHPLEALSQAEVAIELQPDYARGHLIRGEALLMLGRADAALAAFEKAASLNPEDRPRISIFRARALAATGRGEEGQRLLNAIVTNAAWREGRYDFYDRAAVLGQMGRSDEAFEALRQAIEAREGGVRFVLYDPALDRLQGDPRLNEIARRLRLKG